MEEQGRLAEALNAYAEEPDTTTVAGVPLFITTDPAGTTIFVDGDYVGVSPLQYVALAEGRHLISVLKSDYAQLDTVVTLNEASASLQLTLRQAEAPLLDEDTPLVSDEVQPTVSDEDLAAADEEQPAASVGELQINSEPSGASVLVAGQEVGVTPLLLSEVQVGP